MSQHEEYTSPPGFRISGAGGAKLAPVLIDPAAPAGEGDVITRVGTGYAPQAPSGGGGGALTVVRHAANATLNTTTDAGAVHLVTADGVTLTLPTLADGLVYDVIDGSAAANASIAPQSADSVRLANFTRSAGTAIHNDGAPNARVAVVGVAGFGWVTNGDNGFDHWG